MPRASKSTTETTTTTAPVAAAPVAAVAVAEPVAATAVAEKEKKPRAPRVKKEAAAAATEPVAAVPAAAAAAAAAEPVVAETTEVAGVEDSKASRVAPTRESVLADLAETISLIEQEIAHHKESGAPAAHTRFLRTVVRRLKSSQTNIARVLRQKAPSSRKNNNSGFLKPVKISEAMAKFTGLDVNALHSRVDVTKFLCKYIEDHKLQNPDDKRVIQADPALSKLLGYDAKKAEKALTYPHVQSLLKTHFTKAT